jgi:hypothetical protein
MYKAPSKLVEAPDFHGYGYKVDAFLGTNFEQLNIVSHTFSDCIGRIKFSGTLKYIEEDAFLRCDTL